MPVRAGQGGGGGTGDGVIETAGKTKTLQQLLGLENEHIALFWPGCATEIISRVVQRKSFHHTKFSWDFSHPHTVKTQGN